MTAPRDGERIKVVVEGTFIGSTTVEGRLSGYVKLAPGVEVFLTQAAMDALTVEVLTPADYPGRPGTVWASASDTAYLLVSTNLFPFGVALVRGDDGRMHDPAEVATNHGPMRRVQVGDPS